MYLLQAWLVSIFGDCRSAPDDESAPPQDRLFRTSVVDYLLYIRYIYRLMLDGGGSRAPGPRKLIVSIYIDKYYTHRCGSTRGDGLVLGSNVVGMRGTRLLKSILADLGCVHRERRCLAVVNVMYELINNMYMREVDSVARPFHRCRYQTLRRHSSSTG
jgi:hypothetical protein